MKPSILVLLLMQLLIPASLFAQNKSPFDAWDKNGDGQLTKEELPPNVRQNFEKADANNDGMISRKEDSAFRRRAVQRSNAPRQSRTPANIEMKSDLAYAGTDNPRQKLDLFSQRNDQSKIRSHSLHSSTEAAGEMATNAADYTESLRSSSQVNLLGLQLVTD